MLKNYSEWLAFFQPKLTVVPCLKLDNAKELEWCPAIERQLRLPTLSCITGIFILYINEPGHEKMCLMLYANNKGADQPAHPRGLISAFVVRCLDSVMSLVSVTKISSLMISSVAEQASLSLTWSETPEDTFCRVVAQMYVMFSCSWMIQEQDTF